MEMSSPHNLVGAPRGTSRGNSKHFGHTPFSDHSYQPEHPSATRNHPNSQQGLDRSSCLLDTFSSPNSGFNDFSSSSVQSDSGDKHPSVVNTEFTPTTGLTKWINLHFQGNEKNQHHHLY